MLEIDVRVRPAPKAMQLTRDVHCRLPEAVRAMHTFALLHGDSRLAASASPRIEFICEPLSDEPAAGTQQSCEVFFVHWVCPPPFHLPALLGVVSASSRGLTTTVSFDAIYEPDPGIICAIFDRCIGRRFAKGAVTTFFQRLLQFVEREAGLDNLLDRLLEDGRSTGRT